MRKGFNLDSLIILSAILLLSLIILDIGTTIFAVGYLGAQEGNPLAECLIEKVGVWSALLSMGILQSLWFIMCTLYLLDKQLLRKTYLTVLIFSVVLRAVVVANNFGVIYNILR